MATTRTKTSPPKYTKHLLDRNFSSRHGAPIQAVAIHSTESADRAGWDDLHGVRSWFNNAQSSASSHLGIDGEGHTEMWVPSTYKAWTILQLNPVTLNIEFVGRAGQVGSEWEEAQLKAGARWAAYWCLRFKIPVARGVVKNNHGFPVIAEKGIIKHSDLTEAGFGSHTDPGKNFPMPRFMELTRYYAANGWTPDSGADHGS
jgi:N-acetyl-anhydromuramyl-L-alanine amidase AmpD